METDTCSQCTEDAAPAMHTTTDEATPRPLISWPGYGILFFWQLGVLQYLEAAYDLSQAIMVGSSAGSMLSVLAACGVEPKAALNLAHQLCLQHRVFERPLGLMGVWGGIVREWLDHLLPADAAERCAGRVRIVITTLPFVQRQVISSFEDRADLIDCCLASSHVPFLMDWQAAAVCRGRRCVDGSMLYILTGRCHGLRPLTHLSSLLLFDPFGDWQLLRGTTWGDMLRCVMLTGKDGAQQLLNQGFQHAANLDRSGALQPLAPYKRVSGAAAQGCGDSAGDSSLPEEMVQPEAQLHERGELADAAGLLGSLDGSCSGFSADAVAFIADVQHADK